MYARILEFVPKLEKREEFIKAMDDEVQPILRKHNGFVDALLLFQIHSEKALAISLWTERTYAEPYERECFQKVQEILDPYLTMPIIVKHYADEIALGGHFEKVA
jgi:protoheme ferro-lyase